jgi:NTP pyrophosphatase (non-canonical NTP hydrolase)
MKKTKNPGDAVTPIADLKRKVARFAKERDWEQFHAPKNLSMAIAAEAAELMEHFLWSDPAASRKLTVQKKAAVASELADILLFAFQFANMTKIDLSKAMSEKIKANAQKYPVDKSRGRSTKYTEL